MAVVVLVDTNRSSIPVYDFLVARGDCVWVVGADVSAPLARIAENFHQLDYADEVELERWCAEIGAEFAVPGVTDESYRVLSQFRGRMAGIDSHEQFLSFHDKRRFREVASSLSLPVPSSYGPENVPASTEIIVKPVDSFSGKGMSTITSVTPTAIASAVTYAEYHSRSNSCILEQYIEGQLYSYSSFISEGVVVKSFMVREDCVTSPFAVDVSVVERNFPTHVEETIRVDIQRYCAAVGVSEGLVHAQFILDHDGQYWYLELARRSPGDLYSEFVTLSTGFQYAEAYSSSFLGKRMETIDHAPIASSFIRCTISPKSDVSFRGLNFRRPVHIHSLYPLRSLGESLEGGAAGRVAILFLQTESDSERDELYSLILEGDLYDFK